MQNTEIIEKKKGLKSPINIFIKIIFAVKRFSVKYQSILTYEMF